MLLTPGVRTDAINDRSPIGQRIKLLMRYAQGNQQATVPFYLRICLDFAVRLNLYLFFYVIYLCTLL